MNYNEEQALTAYVWHNYRHRLMTESEKVINEAISRHFKFDHKWHRRYGPNQQSLFEECEEPIPERRAVEWLKENDEYNEESLRALDDPDWFCKKVRERILRDHQDDMIIKRCEECQRVVVTPLAKQCLWCGHDWH